MKNKQKKTLSAQLTKLVEETKISMAAQDVESTLLEEIRRRQELLDPEAFSDKEVKVKRGR